MGVRMGQVFALAKGFIEMPPGEIEKLLESPLHEVRVGAVSTLYSIGKGDVADAFKIAEILLRDDQDLIHKATGWALRYAGDKDPQKLLGFLDKHAATMPRTTLRYAIEHLDRKQREHYLGMKQEVSGPA